MSWVHSVHGVYDTGPAQYCRISKNMRKKNWFFFFPLILRIKSSLQMYCNRTICLKIRVIKYKFCCNSMISQPLPNFKTQFSPKDEMCSYDNIALNQRYLHAWKLAPPPAPPPPPTHTHTNTNTGDRGGVTGNWRDRERQARVCVI